MSFETLALEPGRLAASILELDLDACELTYGDSPCTASLALTNIIRESQTLDVGATWAPFNASISANTGLDPILGALTADRLLPDDFVANEVKQLTQPINTTLLVNTTDIFTASIFAKAAGVKIARLHIRTNSIDGAFVDVDLNTGQVINSGDLGAGAPFISGKVTQPPSNLSPDWYRLEITFTLASLLVPQFRLALIDDDGSASFVGTAGEGVEYFGAQMRGGTSPGKYQVTTTLIFDGMGETDDLCFNTFGTCQDTPNYIKEVKTYRFIDTLNVPIEISDAFPAILKIVYTPTQLKPGGDLSLRGKVTVQLQDFTHDDAGGPVAASLNKVDKYSRIRTYDPSTQGTFFGKLKARNEFYVGRPMRLLEGYMDEPFSLSNFRTREYIIEEVRGPSATGLVEIIGKDILSLAINNRAKAPTPSVGALAVGMDAVTTSVTVGVGEGAAYDVDPNIRIDDEIMTISSRLVDVLTVTRATGGTTAATHASGAGVQSCLTYLDEPVIDVFQNLLEDFANVNASFIPFTDWEAEETQSLGGYDMTTIISEPTGVTQLMKELAEITLIDLWYSDVDQEIKLKLQTPFIEDITSINDQDHVIKDSLRTRDIQEKRLSRVLIYYGMRNFAQDLNETQNFSLINFEIEVDKESVNKYADERIKVIFTRWFDASNSVQVQLTSTRLLERFGRVPKEIGFDIDAKDVTAFDTGDVFDIDSRIIQDFLGLNKIDRFQVIETNARFPSSIYSYKALAFFTDPELTGGLVIAANETDFDLFVELAGPTGPIEITVTINPGVVIDSTQGNPAFTTGLLHPDSIVTIINDGEIRGHAGDGGNGGNANVTCEFEPELPSPFLFFFNSGPGQAGSIGGTALEVTISDIIIDNTNGDIFGGGGGGGGGGALTNSAVVIGGGGGGGGRGGNPVGTGGAGGTATYTPGFGCPIGPPPTENPGNAGGDGSVGAAGTGGAPGLGALGDGGDGSDFGEAGLDGEDSGSNGGGGGAGGKAINLNGATITFLGGNNPTQIKGDVS